jgi:hypothetical protein
VDNGVLEIRETSLQEMLDKGECLVHFPDGREETVKLTFDFVKANYEQIEFPLINEKEEEVYKANLYRRLKLTDNEDYRLAVARNTLTHEDCGVRECSRDGIVEINELCESYNGVCKLLNDIDKLSLDTRELSKSRVKVLDLGACDDLLNLQILTDQSNKHDTVIILPSASNGYEKFLIVNCAVKSLTVKLYGTVIKMLRVSDCLYIKSIDIDCDEVSLREIIGFVQNCPRLQEIKIHVKRMPFVTYDTKSKWVGEEFLEKVYGEITADAMLLLTNAGINKFTLIADSLIDFPSIKVKMPILRQTELSLSENLKEFVEVVRLE